MILKMKIRWRGRIRATLRQTRFRVQSLIDWNEKNLSQGLLSNPEVVELQAAISICDAKLAEKILM